MPTGTAGSAAVIAGIGAWRAERPVSNEEVCAALDTTNEWIMARTGIANRYVVRPGTSTSDLAVAAGRLALESAGRSRVDAVVVATSTPDQVCPATAPTVAASLGLCGVPAFDIGAVCSGFVYGLATATGLLRAGFFDAVLVIGADTFSTIVDPADRSTAIIFGDGAGGVVLRTGSAAEPGAVRAVDLGSDGDHAHLVGVAAGGSRQRSAGSCASRRDYQLAMRGPKLYPHAVTRMAASCRAVLDSTGWAVEDLDCLVPHQANQRITEAVMARLGLTAEQAFSDIERLGNTAGGSVPIALADAASRGRLREGDRIVVTSFGAGLTWGSATFTWPDVKALHNLP
jgi:3-oxoacyl-[acyl-carrier-protein] synthase-3